MITNSSAYYALLTFQGNLQKVILGQTAGLNPAMVLLGPVACQNLFNKAQATLNAYIALPVGNSL